MSNPLDEPCKCGSGHLYRDCHGPIFTAPQKKQVSVGQDLYASSWGENAATYEAQGIYAKLASELGSQPGIVKVLDMGSGLGQGLAALAAELPEEGRLIAGVDENPYCVAAAVDRLGLTPNSSLHRRLKPDLRHDETFGTVIRKGRIPDPGPITVINADFMIKDESFDAWLDLHGPFDAITMWFTGVHKARVLTKVAAEHELQSDAHHREILEAAQFSLASKHLRPGGVVHLVNRYLSADICKDKPVLAGKANEMLTGTPFDLVALEAYPYQECQSPGSIMVSMPGLDVSGHPRYALSILARLCAN
jgi:SAM-dependent methyltransferase